MSRNELNEVFIANIRWNGLKIAGGDLTPFIHYPFLETVCSNKSLNDVIEKAISMVKTDILDYEEGEFYDSLEYDIEIIHTIFSKSKTDRNELSYEDFVYKYGPVKHKVNLDGKIYLSEFANGTEFDYYSDIYNKEPKFKVGEKCDILSSDESFTNKKIGFGIITKEKINMFNHMDTLNQFDSGYFLEGTDMSGCKRFFDLIKESNLVKNED